MASTAVPTEPNAVIRMTAAEGCRAFADLRTSRPSLAAHLQVAQHDVERPFVQALDGEVAVGRLLDLVPGLGQRPGERAPQRVVVIRNQYPSHSQPHNNRFHHRIRRPAPREGAMHPQPPAAAL